VAVKVDEARGDDHSLSMKHVIMFIGQFASAFANPDDAPIGDENIANYIDPLAWVDDPSTDD